MVYAHPLTKYPLGQTFEEDLTFKVSDPMLLLYFPISPLLNRYEVKYTHNYKDS